MPDTGSKTEKATPKKRRDERKKGNVFLSQDAVAVATLLGSYAVFWILAGSMVEQTGKFMAFCLSAIEGTEASVSGLMSEIFRLALAVVGSLLDRNIPMALMPILAVLNYLLFFWSDLMELLNRGQRRVRHQTSRQTVNFKQATRRAQQQKGYIHKCAVCGKTDTEFPDEEFRYCSKCNGYYCYCTEHLSDHVHIK